MNALTRYVRFWDHEEPAWSLALVRVLVGAVMLFDLLQVVGLSLVVALWAPIEEGGIGPVSYARPTADLYRWIGASAQSAVLLVSVAIVAAAMVMVGFWSRLGALVLLLCSTQFHALSPGADRGIDALLRNALILLVCADAGATLSIDAYRRTRSFAPDVLIRAWPRYLIIAQLVILYFAAGIYKQTAPWSALGGYSALFLTMNKPHYVRFEFPHEVLAAAYPLLQLATIATLLFECSAVLLPIAMWLRNQPERGRFWYDRLPRAFLAWWIATGVFFHVSLGVLMQLGIFPWGCLALYPALFQPQVLRGWFGKVLQLRAARVAAIGLVLALAVIASAGCAETTDAQSDATAGACHRTEAGCPADAPMRDWDALARMRGFEPDPDLDFFEFGESACTIDTRRPPATLDAVAEQSSLIVTGRMIDVVPKVRPPFHGEAEYDVYTEIEPDRIVKGEAPEPLLVFELCSHGAKVAGLRRTLPDDRFFFFLGGPYDSVSAAGYYGLMFYGLGAVKATDDGLQFQHRWDDDAVPRPSLAEFDSIDALADHVEGLR